MGRFSCYIKSRGLNFYCPLRRCSCTYLTLGHYATRNNDPCQPVLPRETYLPSIGRFIPSELSGVQLDEVVHARGRLARELEQIVGHAIVATLLVEFGHYLRPLRFRRVPFGRDVAFDPGGATASRIAMPHMLPSTVPSVSASAKLLL